MAEFCRQCSFDLDGVDYRDLAGITSPEAWGEGLAATVICEGCGFIQVDPDGNCVSNDCLRHGNPGHGLPWIKQEVKP